MQRHIFSVLAFVMFSFAVVQAENWPQWRGPTLNGISNEKNLPINWTPEENIAWKLAMPGGVVRRRSSGAIGSFLTWRKATISSFGVSIELKVTCFGRNCWAAATSKCANRTCRRLRRSPRQERLRDDRYRHPQELRL